MLPFALKIVWFCLSFTGIIVCWVVICMFSKATGSYWLALYSVFATLLQGIFCLGMVYDMNPYQMPKAFCIVQTFVIYYSAWSLTGVCAAFTFATSSCVLWPSYTSRPATSTLAWKNKYYFPIFVFPLTCLSISVPILLSVDAIQPTDDLHCDASNPEWGRFLGYAGLSMILTIPCLFLSTAAAGRVYRLYHGIQRARRAFKHGHSTGRFHTRLQTSNARNVLEREASPVISPSDTIPASIDPETPSSPQLKDAGVDVQDAPPCEFPHPSPSVTFGMFSMTPKRSEVWEALDSIEDDDELSTRRQMGSMMLSLSMRSAPSLRPSLTPAIWRLILFQMAFFIIQCLAALSTVIDVVQRRPTPTPFGSQHVALILVAWGPAIVLGHLPPVRRQLMSWKK